jgi:hypothetical protein
MSFCLRRKVVPLCRFGGWIASLDGGRHRSAMRLPFSGAGLPPGTIPNQPQLDFMIAWRFDHRSAADARSR